MSDPAPVPTSRLQRLAAFFRSLRDFDRSFWSANVSELFERIAFYGLTGFLVLFLSKSQGFSQSAATSINGWFGLCVWGFAAVSGYLADIFGYRRAMLLAYGLLASGYALLAFVPTTLTTLLALLLVAVGASLIKPSITGTVQKTCTEAQRPLGFSIYYMLVNVGGFLGPYLAGKIRVSKAEGGASLSFQISSAAAVVALLIILLLFREPAAVPGLERKRFADFTKDFTRVLRNARFVLMILLVGIYWCLFWQIYNALPLYASNTLHVGDDDIGLVQALDGGAVVCLQVVVGYLVRNLRSAWAVFVAAATAALAMAIFGFGIELPWLASLFGVHPAVPWLIVGILVIAVGEMIYSAHFYRYLGSIAPANQVGMYMGFAFLPIAFGSFTSGQIGGRLYEYCDQTLHAPHVVWYMFAGLGVVAAIGMLLLARGGDERPASTGA